MCPIGMDVPAYISLLRAGRIDDAYRVLKRTNPFPSVCGRICAHDCQMKCRRGQLDEPVAIMHLKRFITDHAKRLKVDPLPILRKEKVAIIGAGPSGFTAALEFKKRGYGVTVFEELPEAGGMLRWSIPAFRLPRNELDREIEDILQTGVQLRTNTRVGRDVAFEDLDRNFDVIYLATGAQKSSSLNIPGEDAEGVLRRCRISPGVQPGQRNQGGQKCRSDRRWDLGCRHCPNSCPFRGEKGYSLLPPRAQRHARTAGADQSRQRKKAYESCIWWHR